MSNNPNKKFIHKKMWIKWITFLPTSLCPRKHFSNYDDIIIKCYKHQPIIQFFIRLTIVNQVTWLVSKFLNYAFFCGLVGMFLCILPVYSGVPYAFLIKFSYQKKYFSYYIFRFLFLVSLGGCCSA